MNYRALCATGAIVLGSVIAVANAADELKADAAVTVEMTTNLGTVVMELDAQKAPQSVKNFVTYARKGHYNDTVFHRVIEGFMAQGGGLDKFLKEKPTLAPVPNEAANGLKNAKYTVAMARTSDPNSATSQFFINTGDNHFLNRDEAEDGYGYAVFGRVVKGQEVVDKINEVATQPQPNPAFPAMLMRDVPVEPIVITSVKILGDKEG
ncbi:peptidylprolyl isomerase [Planctomycetes bacterium K23_9]|uniref:Peptidyl-prolyl cis-trans isomerase n=1 Tax=Stieleria marina TaxID=1930275 RepID=A0A517NQ26_9BACT|nr:Peptidyl-prolyl cis-trans isomerase cyp18 [Planctomycetes bacterium K23_9]